MQAENINLKIENWTEQIDKTTKKFKTRFGVLTEEQLNWKPNAQTWSIAQNIEHLIIINKSYFPILKTLREGAYKTPFIGKMRFLTKWMGKAMLKAVQPNRKKKTKTFIIWEPTKEEKIINILKQFENHQERLKKEIKSSKNSLKKGVVISSPVNKNIVYPLETAFEILIAHEKRHYQQAKEVLEKLF